MDNSTYDYNDHLQNIMILQVIQQVFCEMLIGGRKIVYTDMFFEVINTRTNIQNYYSEFEGLLREWCQRNPL